MVYTDAWRGCGSWVCNATRPLRKVCYSAVAGCLAIFTRQPPTHTTSRALTDREFRIRIQAHGPTAAEGQVAEIACSS